MSQIRLILLFFTALTLRRSECSVDERGEEFSSLSRSEHGPSQQLSARGVPFGPSLRSNPVYAPYRGSFLNLLLSLQSSAFSAVTSTECEAKAATNGAHYWKIANTQCFTGRLAAPVCASVYANETGYHILQNFLTEGSPNDDPFPNTSQLKAIIGPRPYEAFRVMTPTITEIPMIAKRPNGLLVSTNLKGKLFLFSKIGVTMETSSDIPIDPVCYTNSSCGVPFVTAPNYMYPPHVVLHKVCGQTIELKKNNSTLNVFSHEGIGCKFFPCAYPSRSCELTITSCHFMNASVSLVNFRKTTCEGYELKVFVLTKDGVMQEYDMCKEDAEMEIVATAGKVKIMFSGSPTSNWQRYGFNIKLVELPTPVNSPQCS